MKNNYQQSTGYEGLSKEDMEEIIRSMQIQQNALLSELVTPPKNYQLLLKSLKHRIREQSENVMPAPLADDFKNMLEQFKSTVLKQLKEKEEQLENTKAYLASVTENTNVSIGQVDKLGILQNCNNPFRQLFRRLFHFDLREGVSLNEVFAFSELSERISAQINLCLGGHGTQVTEIVTQQQQSTILNFRFHPIQRQNTCVGVTIFIEELTRKQQNESLLRLLNSAVIYSNDAIVMTEIVASSPEKSLIVYANRAFYELSGYTTEEVIGSPQSMLHGPLSSDEEFQEVREAMRAGQSVRTEFINYRKDGSTYWVNFSTVPLKDQSGKVTHWISILRDISENKRAEETIREQKQFLESINRNISEAIVCIQSDMQIRYSNKAFQDLFDYQKDEITLEDLFADKASLQIFNQTLEEKGFINNTTFLFKRKDGSTFWGLTSFSINENFGQKQYEGAIRDISDNKETEKVLQEKNDALKKTNDELDRFVYSASHDLRAPLASTLGLINISRISQSDQEKQTYLDMMEQSLNKMDKTIQDITDYARNARLEIECEEIQLESMITDILQRLKYLKHVDDVKVNTIIKGEEKFFTDKIRLYVVLINLISNAIKFHRYDAAEPYINISVNICYETAHILVEDNGIGIEEKHLEKIFGMFFQAARESSGSGLGLYIVKETINKLQGSIKVNSRINEGSCFEITLPNEIKNLNI